MPMSTITVAGIKPSLNILGQTQQFIFDQPISSFQVINNFIPTSLVSSQFNQEFRNNLFSGFRLSHKTTNTDTYGSLTLQSFVNAQSTGSDIIKFDSTGINILAPFNMNNQPIINSKWNGNTIEVSYGGTGNTNATPYSLICGGTTGTGALQYVNSVGTTGQVLTSQGPNALPVWATKGSGTVTSITAGNGLSGGIITGSGTISIDDTDVEPGTYNGPYRVNSRGQVTAASNKLTGILAFTHIVGNTATATNITANNFTKVLGNTHQSILNSFTAPANNRLQYVGSDTIICAAHVDLSAIPAVSSTLSVAIYKNGTTAIPGSNYNYQLTALKPINLNLEVPVTFSTNDYIEVFITSDNNDNVIVSDMNLSVTT